MVAEPFYRCADRDREPVAAAPAGPRRWWGSGSSTRARGRSPLTARPGPDRAGWGSPGPDGADPDWVPGISGSALRFDGGDAVVVTDSHGARARAAQRGDLGAPTRHARPLRLRSVEGQRRLRDSSYGLYTGTGGGVAFYVSNGSRLRDLAGRDAGADLDGAWHQVVGSYDGHEVRLYVDGVEIGGGSPNTQPIVYGLASTAPYIGIYRGGCELGFTGDIDTIRIWGAALTPAEIAALVQRSPRRWRGRRAAAQATPLSPVSGQPPRAAPSCVASSARETVRVGRRTVLAVTVRRNGRPLQARARAAERQEDPARAHHGRLREGPLRRPPAALREAPAGPRARALVPEHERRRPPPICGGRGDPPSSAAVTRSTSPRLPGALVGAGRGVRVAGLL